ncbi:MAG: hypothetical protein U0572_06690 [Phycisphaerales bacterium]
MNLAKWWLAAVATAAIVGGCGTTRSYLVTVTDAGSARPVEGASVELKQDASGAARTTATTDGRGEAVLRMNDASRTFLLVTFDGTINRFYVRPDLAPAWNAAPEQPSEPSGAIRFLAGAPSSGPTPAWSVRIVRLQ